MAELTFLQAVNQALDEEMSRDPNIIILGEDVRLWGAPRGEFKGLFEKYGPDRVLDTPISETAILGGAIGAAATGLRPIANIMYANFLGVCGDEILNQLTQLRYMVAGKIKLPVTIMSYCGAGFSAGAHHSKTVHGLLMAIPGLKIAFPSTPRDAKGLLKSAIRDDNPVIFLSHQMLMRRGLKEEISDEEYVIPLGVANIKREGADVTVVSSGFMVQRALAVADKLQEENISVEVIDPRTWMPLDRKTIIESVKKTSRLVILEEEPITGGAAAEIVATVSEKAFDFLDAPIKRVCAPDTPIPFSPVLEQAWIPSEKKLITAIKEVV
ncbi:alpha-ketoacid dehydrogenase subunit beta [Chloroflexota bacterium]